MQKKAISVKQLYAMPIDELAKLFNRSRRAIELRLRKLEQEMKPLTKEDLKEEYDKAFGSKKQMF